MTGDDDSGNPARLPLAERARRGLLAGESELWLHEVAELEFPHDKMKRAAWEKLLHGLIAHGAIYGCSMQSLPRNAYRLCLVKNRVVIVAWRIPRDAYRTWRATQPDTPAGSLIHLWLGAPTLPQGEPAPLPQGEPDKPESGAAVNKPEKPRLSDKEILALRQQGLSNKRIHEEYSVPKDRITRVNKSKGVTPLAPGPKPKVSG